jgi:hypothetical protein
VFVAQLTFNDETQQKAHERNFEKKKKNFYIEERERDSKAVLLLNHG